MMSGFFYHAPSISKITAFRYLIPDIEALHRIYLCDMPIAVGVGGLTRPISLIFKLIIFSILQKKGGAADFTLM